MPPSDFANANVDEIVDKLTTEEAILLTAGVGFWHTHAVERLGIPAIKVSDGPNGIRGNHFFMGTPAKCLPSSTALGATWDPELVTLVGRRLLAEEAKLRAASIVLAPTCNIQRNPLGGRSFESFSEDPILSGHIAAAYINGVQSGGIGATIKHFVGNDKENDRFGYDSIISPRALREVYLMPFMLAQKYAQPWAYMTAYNRVNGVHVSENPDILRRILREEWGYDGLIMSDWFGTYSISHALNAGLDLEMPGTNKWRSLDLVSRSIQARKVRVGTVKERARRVVQLAKKCAAGAGEILDGDGLERTHTTDEDKELLRRVAAESIVLLKNDKQTLPLDLASVASKKDSKKVKVAVVGGNAKASILSGGGSAALKPEFFVSPYQGIVDAVEEAKKSLGEDVQVEVGFEEGARTYMNLPTLERELTPTPSSSTQRGWTAFWYNNTSDFSNTPDLGVCVQERVIDETRMFISTSTPEGIVTKRWTLKLKGYLALEADKDEEEWEFGLVVAGRAKLFIDGALVIDNWTRQTRGDSFFGCGTIEERGRYTLKRGVQHEVVVEYCNVRGPADGDEDEVLMDSNPGVRLGGAPVVDPVTAIQQAVELAKDSDVVIAVVGLNADWETEGNDRITLALPGKTDELITSLCAVNPNVVVVLQAGSAVALPWASLPASIVHAWYLGNSTGHAIADVLFGKKNPSGKLSITFPARETDIPAYGSTFESEEGMVRYGEGVFVGYKHYVQRNIKPLFPFGFGLSYTSFALSNLKIAAPTYISLPSPSSFVPSPSAPHPSADIAVTLNVTLTNTGSFAGSQVVQVYVGYPNTSSTVQPSPLLAGPLHPQRQLKAFKKVIDVQPSAAQDVSITLDKYAFSYWREGWGGVDDKSYGYGHGGDSKWDVGRGGEGWVVEKGVYNVWVGFDSALEGGEGQVVQGQVVVEKGFVWRGL